MAKSGTQRGKVYRTDKAHIDLWELPEVKKRFIELADRYQITQIEMF